MGEVFYIWGSELNRFMRAIGFSKPLKRKEIQALIEAGIKDCKYRAYTTDDEDENTVLAQFEINFGDDFGICVCGQFDEDDQFYPDYYYPFLNTNQVSSTEEISVEPRIDNDSYAGICEDLRVGVTLIFRLRNTVEYLKCRHTSFAPMENTSVILTALAAEGTVLMPVYKTDEQIQQVQEENEERMVQIRRAKRGDEDASRELTALEMDQYAGLMEHIRQDDIYSIVDSYLMPYGAECELYSILGEIKKTERRINCLTMEEMTLLRVDCNGLELDILIHQDDLFGQPEIGRRFRGCIWMQGKICFGSMNKQEQ